MRHLHGIVGLLGVVIFLATGQYMDRWHDHLRGMEDAQRLLFRSTHIYILFISLLNLSFGLYLTLQRRRWRRAFQWFGSALLVACLPVAVLGFLSEPWLIGLERPYSRLAIYGSFAALIAHSIASIGADRELKTGSQF